MHERILKKTEGIVDFYNTRDPFKLCNEMGIIVTSLDLPESVNGIYTILYDQNTIILNSSLDENERRVICAHELGHVMLHNSLNCLDLARNTNYCMDAFELEADTFAACLLIDDEEIRSKMSDEPVCISDIAAAANIPEYYVSLRYRV